MIGSAQLSRSLSCFIFVVVLFLFVVVLFLFVVVLCLFVVVLFLFVVVLCVGFPFASLFFILSVL